MNNKLLSILVVGLLAAVPFANAQLIRKVDASRSNRDAPQDKQKQISLKLELVDGDKNGSDLRISANTAISIKVLASVSDNRTIGLSYYERDEFVNYRLLLLRPDDIPVPFPQSVLSKIQQNETLLKRRKTGKAVVKNGGPSIFITPGRENPINVIKLSDWYGKLSAGTYTVFAGFRFDGSKTFTYSAPIVLEIY